jgi:hypothetical protein
MAVRISAMSGSLSRRLLQPFDQPQDPPHPPWRPTSPPARRHVERGASLSDVVVTDEAEAYKEVDDLARRISADVQLASVEDNHRAVPLELDVRATTLRIVAHTGDVGPVWMAKNELHARRTSRPVQDQPLRATGSSRCTRSPAPWGCSSCSWARAAEPRCRSSSRRRSGNPSAEGLRGGHSGNRSFWVFVTGFVVGLALECVLAGALTLAGNAGLSVPDAGSTEESGFVAVGMPASRTLLASSAPDPRRAHEIRMTTRARATVLASPIQFGNDHPEARALDHGGRGAIVS